METPFQTSAPDSAALRPSSPLVYRNQSLPSTMADRHETLVAKSAASNVLPTKIDPTSARFEANMRFLADLMSQVRNEGEKIGEGGGAKAIESQHNKGRKTARERIDLLVDPEAFFELGTVRGSRHVRRMGWCTRRGSNHWPGSDRNPPGDDHRQ